MFGDLCTGKAQVGEITDLVRAGAGETRGEKREAIRGVCEEERWKWKYVIKQNRLYSSQSITSLTAKLRLWPHNGCAID